MFYTNIAVHGNSILFRGMENGREIRTKIPFSPYFFIPTKKETEYKSLFDESLEKVTFETIREARDFIQRYKDVDNFKLFGQERFEYAFIADKFKKNIEWNVDDISIAIIDIETAKDEFGAFPDAHRGNGAITSITLNFLKKKKYVFGYKDYVVEGNEEFIRCDDERDLCKRFLSVWTSNYPNIVSGWNSVGYDIPYIINRFNLILGETETKRLSPWNNIWSRKSNFKGRETIVYNITGIASLDYLELYKWYAPGGNSKESYKLDFIAREELGEGKVEYEEFDNLDELYEKDYQKFIRYNIKDTDLIVDLEDKLKLLELAISVAYDSKVNFEDIFSQTRLWDSLCYNYLLERNVIIPFKEISDVSEAYEGAFVKEPIPGKYYNIVTEDFNSMYPNLFIFLNISPETIVDPKDYTKEMIEIVSKGVSVEKLLNREIDTSKISGYSLSPNGQFFRTDKPGFIPIMLEEMYNNRVKYKDMMLECKKKLEIEKNPVKIDDLKKDIAKYNNLQLAKKTNLVSIYGANGCRFFRFYDIRLALAITLSGQLAIRWVSKYFNDYLNSLLKSDNIDYVLYCDTDSAAINLDPLVKKVNVPDNKIVNFLDKVAEEKLQPVVNNSCKELAEYLHAVKPSLKMKREKICTTGIWTGKKKYALNVWDNEGVRYSEPKIKITGLEIIRSSTPNIVRNEMRKLLSIIMNDTEKDVQNFIANFKKEFKILPVESIAFPRGVNGISEYSDSTTLYKKGTPIHVKGCILYNHYLKKMGLEKKYQKIQNGEKIKFTYLKNPNPLQNSVISFTNKLPVEFGLHKYVDYDLMFEKTFIAPIEIILNAIGWKTEQQFNLESFFGEWS